MTKKTRSQIQAGWVQRQDEELRQAQRWRWQQQTVQRMKTGGKQITVVNVVVKSLGSISNREPQPVYCGTDHLSICQHNLPISVRFEWDTAEDKRTTCHIVTSLLLKGTNSRTTESGVATT